MNSTDRDRPPEPPAFGQPLALSRSAEVLRFLARRRSASALTLCEPGPTENERADLLRLAARAPDHGKLFPWRFIVLEGEAKRAFVKSLGNLAAHRPDADKAVIKLGKIAAPPLTIAVVSRFTEGEIPEWEQRLSAGAVAMLLVIAAGALGYGANWITDWYAYDAQALELLGLKAGERVAGFVHIGTPREAPLERVRPDVDALTTIWRSE